MDELFRLSEEVDDKFAKIPKGKLTEAAPCLELDEYNIALDNFMIEGRKKLCDGALSFDDIRDKLSSFAIMEAKEILRENAEGAYTTLLSSPRMVQSIVERLELVLNELDSVGETFYTNPAYTGDKNFLLTFDAFHLSSFRALQDYIRELSSGR